MAETVKYLTLGLLASGVKQRRPHLRNLGDPSGDGLCVPGRGGPQVQFLPPSTTPTARVNVRIFSRIQAPRIAYAEDEVQLEKLKVVWDECPALERIIVHKMSEPQKDPPDHESRSIDCCRKRGVQEKRGQGISMIASRR